MSSDVSPVDRLRAIADALDAVASAAAAADTDRLSVCEHALGTAAAAMPGPDDLASQPLTLVREQVLRIRFALERCRAIGRATSELITTTLSAQGMAPGYLPAGVGAQAPRVGQLEARV